MSKKISTKTKAYFETEWVILFQIPPSDHHYNSHLVLNVAEFFNIETEL